MRRFLIALSIIVVIFGATLQVSAVSTNPLMGANYVVLSETTYYHDLFGSHYNAQHVENTLQIMQEWGMKYVRVFDGALMPSRNYLPASTRNNIIDFLNRAKNHGLTVYFQFSHLEQWALNLYKTRSGHQFEQYYSEFTDIGKAIVAERVKYITGQCFSSRTENLIISLYNEPQFTHIENESIMRNKAISWTNYMYDQVRSIDNRSNHLITLALVQGNAALAGWSGWLWHPGDLFNFTKIELIDMHFYHLDYSKTWTQEFDTVFGWWVPYSTKPVIISETGMATAEGNEKDASKKLLDTIHYIRNNPTVYGKIGAVLIWSVTPYFTNYDITKTNGYGVPDGPFHRLMDGYQGYTRFGTSIWYDQFLEASFSTNYATQTWYPASNVNDYNKNTHSIIMHVPSYSTPNETVIEYNQWYRFHKIRIADNIMPYPKDFDVFVYGPTGWLLFQSVRGNTKSSVDLLSTQPEGWQSGHAIKIRVYDEQNNWSSISEVYVNPVSFVTIP